MDSRNYQYPVVGLQISKKSFYFKDSFIKWNNISRKSFWFEILVEIKHEVIWFAVATKQIEIIQHAKIEGESI